MLPSTKRITFRKFEDTAHDHELVFQLNSNAQVMQYIGNPKSRSDAQEDLKRYLRYYHEHPGYGYLMAMIGAEQSFVGWYVVKLLPETLEPEIGYRLLPEFWNQGLATEGAAACLKYGFDKMKFSRMVAVANPLNKGSIKVLEKLGMQYQHTGTYYQTECAYYCIKNE